MNKSDSRGYNVRISKTLYNRIMEGCRQLKVSRKNLIIFLMTESYDDLCVKDAKEQKKIIDEELKKYKQESETAKRKQEEYEKKREKEGNVLLPEEEISFRVSAFVDGYIEELAQISNHTKGEVIISLILNYSRR